MKHITSHFSCASQSRSALPSLWRKTLLVCLLTVLCAQNAFAVRVKELAKVAGSREYGLVGYGLVVGLSGTGDSSRNLATMTSIANTLTEFGVQLPAQAFSSRNVAGVMVTAKLSSFAEIGQNLDVQVSSMGDARSLTGGTLLMTPLYGPDKKLYVLAQGELIVGGFQFESELAKTQRNFPSSGRVPAGGTVESAPLAAAANNGSLALLLNEADFTTATRMADAIKAEFPTWQARAVHAGRVEVKPSGAQSWVQAAARLENVQLTPDQIARVVVSEKTGTLIAGADVRIAPVSITHGGLNIDIRTSFSGYGGTGLFIGDANSNNALLVPNQTMSISEPTAQAVAIEKETTVAELVTALQKLKLSARDLVVILQGIKKAGALRAELVIQ